MSNRKLQEHDRFKQALSSTTKALADGQISQVDFGDLPARLRGGEEGDRLTLPMPARNFISSHDLDTTRAGADLEALTHALHAPSLHAGFRPADMKIGALFDALENARINAVGSNSFTGLGNNLDRLLAEKFAGEEGVELAEPDALELVMRARLTGRSLPKNLDDQIKPVAQKLEMLEPELVSKLTENLRDQKDFAGAALQLLRAWNGEAGEPASEDQKDEQEEQNEEEEDRQTENEEDLQDTEDGLTDEEESEERQESQEEPEISELGQDRSEDSEDDPQDLELPQQETPDNIALDKGFQYRIYTIEFDEIKHAHELCPADELERLRLFLDKQLQPLQGIVRRLANRLHRKLLSQQMRSWQFDLEEGILDTARLTRVVTDPTAPLSFKQESDIAFKDTVVTLLIDNSGSMRGRPIMAAALTGDILAQTLERCKVKVEVLGFTTKSWKGGLSKEKWLQDGRPVNPGRLNDLRHIIYKSADMPWRRARTNLGLMMREGLLKENIDGEALLWAQSRLNQRPEKRKILMAISDGAPVDDTTQSTNPNQYLDRHLRFVINQIENHTDIQLTAIGIHHDVTRWYRDAITLHDAEQLGDAVMDELEALFEEDNIMSNRKSRFAA